MEGLDMESAIETWRWAWREGAAPLLADADLTLLQDALQRDDPRLLQGATTNPPPCDYATEVRCEGGCPLAFVGWQNYQMHVVKDVEDFFARLFTEIGQRLGDLTGARWLTNWIDETPRDEMRRLLGEEITRTLAERRVSV
jgi:hypothetical protein